MKTGIINKIKEIEKRRRKMPEERPSLELPIRHSNQPVPSKEKVPQPSRVIIIDLN